MPTTSPDRIVLTDAQRGDLDRLVRAGRTEQRLALRAGIVLAAADGHPNARIAASLGICEDTARKWRHRWCAAPGVSSLGDAKRCGRPAVFTAVQVAQVKALACTPPKDSGLPLSRWSCPELARQAVSGGICERSRPRRCAGGCPRTPSNRGSTSRGSSSPTPTSQPKAQRVLDLYQRIWDGKPLGRERLRDLRRREDLHPGPLPLPPHPAAGQGPDDAGQPRLPPPRRGGLPRRLRRAPREGLRPLRGHHRDRPVQPPGRAGHDPGALQISGPGVLDRGQRLLTPRRKPRSTGSPTGSPTRSWCTPRCTPHG